MADEDGLLAIGAIYPARDFYSPIKWHFPLVRKRLYTLVVSQSPFCFVSPRTESEFSMKQLLKKTVLNFPSTKISIL
jgi:hypothetical protein